MPFILFNFLFYKLTGQPHQVEEEGPNSYTCSYVRKQGTYIQERRTRAKRLGENKATTNNESEEE